MKSQIATTREQADRLLKCGVPAESADMCYQHIDDCVNNTDKPICNTPKAQYNTLIGYGFGDSRIHIAPAFSLSSLLGFLPKEIKVDESPYDEIQKYGLLIYPYMGGWQVDYQYCEDDECHCLKCVYGADLIEACVKAIEWLSANGYALNGIEKGGEEQ